MSFERARAGATIGLACLISALCIGVAGADPLDLADSTPRWVEVRFEVSPGDAPGRLDHVWSAPRRAFFEPTPDPERILIRIPGEELETQLRSTGADPVHGTFSEFVWTLDAATGHVLQAELTGRLRERFSIGFFRSSTEVEIRIEMTTGAPAGYRPPNQILGQRMHGFCEGSERPADCTLVEPARFDPERGYVNAVGSLEAVSALAQILTFSPLGEVVFSESDLDPSESVISGRSSHEEVCSAPMNGSCRPDFRGESS